MKRVALTAIFVMAAFCLAAQERGVITLSEAFLRAAPDYESPLETQALMGSEAEVLERESYWIKVRLSEPEYVAWVTELGLQLMGDEQIEAYRAAPKYICLADASHVYSKPSRKSLYVSEFILGDLVRQALSASGNPLRKGAWLKVVMPDGREGWVPRTDVEDFERWQAVVGLTRVEDLQDATGPDAFGESIVATAYRFLGTPYMWAGNTIKHCDCSGLTWMVFYLNGVILPRNASQQAKFGEEVPLPAYDEPWSPSAYSALKPGDLVYFGRIGEDGTPRVTHVAISLGGDRIIQASQVVRINSLNPSAPDFYDRKPLFARRIKK